MYIRLHHFIAAAFVFLFDKTEAAAADEVTKRMKSSEEDFLALPLLFNIATLWTGRPSITVLDLTSCETGSKREGETQGIAKQTRQKNGKAFTVLYVTDYHLAHSYLHGTLVTSNVTIFRAETAGQTGDRELSPVHEDKGTTGSEEASSPPDHKAEDGQGKTLEDRSQQLAFVRTVASEEKWKEKHE
ncbi:hypothetical protein FOL47_004846 [Perkinsus chesapeaki]|uniref:Uncharacterized protein n=1 Tax=Perkinsus chesapeaki TaxID=330153 RepID=A0A7J6M099_PERCH|nr:hypothetical protein FOL47_004846 [Perkinsus chesapeaki]